jgi:hypothetical protein
VKNTSRSLIAAAAAVALLALAGCSDDATPEPTPTDQPTATDTNTPVDPTETPDGEDTNVPVPTISANPETGKFEWCDPAEQEPFTGDAAKKFGPEKVMNAYCTMVELQMENQFVDSLLRQDDGFVKQDFEAVREHLSQSTRADFDADVAALVAGNATPEQMNDIRGLVAFDFAGSELALEEPAVFNQRFSPADIWIDDATGRQRLGMEFTVGADLALLRTSDDERLAYAYDRTITFWLTPGRKGGEREWYIDGYTSTVADAAPVPREKLIK